MNFGYGPASEVKRPPADALEQLPLLRRSRGDSEGFAPDLRDLRAGPARTATPLDRWLAARARRARARVPRRRSTRYGLARPRARRRALLGRPLELVRPRLARRASGAAARRQDAAFAHAAGTPSCRSARLIAPVDAVPRRGAVAEPRRAARARTRRARVHLAGFPEVDEAALDAARWPRCATCATSSRSGRRRARTPPSCKLRQPLAEADRRRRAARSAGLERQHDEIAPSSTSSACDGRRPAEELVERRGRAELPRARPAAGQDVPKVQAPAREGQYTRRGRPRSTVGDHVLGQGDYELRSPPREGFEVGRRGRVRGRRSTRG